MIIMMLVVKAGICGVGIGKLINLLFFQWLE